MTHDASISLTTSQNFELERMKRAIDTVDNVSELRELTKQLAEAWMIQRAACSWIMGQTHETIPSMSLLKERRSKE